MREYNTIEEALEELRQGRMILVTDDPDRENEGDLICAAEFATTENVNFMATHGKGLICMPMSEEMVSSFRRPSLNKIFAILRIILTIQAITPAIDFTPS